MHHRIVFGPKLTDTIKQSGIAAHSNPRHCADAFCTRPQRSPRNAKPNAVRRIIGTLLGSETAVHNAECRWQRDAKESSNEKWQRCGNGERDAANIYISIREQQSGGRKKSINPFTVGIM